MIVLVLLLDPEALLLRIMSEYDDGKDQQLASSWIHFNYKKQIFLEAVDPVKLNIPDYPDIIKNPMDLGTIESKLHNDQYDSIDAFASDIKLMFDNCYLYNGPQDPVSALGRSLQKVFDRGMKKKPGRSFVPAGSMPEDDYYRCEKTIREFKKKKHSEYAWIFSKPVDAEAWGATNYHEIIKTPMDLSTMENKLLDHQYKNEQEFVDDMRLMFQNCYTYNPPMHPVHALGKKFEAVFDAYWEKLHEDNQGDYKKKNNASKGLKRDASSFDSIPSQPKRSRQNVEELGTSQDTKPSVLKLRLPTASLKQNLTPQSTPTSASPVPASNNNHHLHLAISKHPPASQSASSSSTSATSSTNTKRLALSDTKLSTPTKPNASTSLSLSAQRRPNTTSTTARPQQQHPNARPNEANKVPPNKMANKLPSKPVPKKPAPQAFDVGVLLDGIAQEKEQREREKRLQQEQQLRFEEKKRENEMRRRQEEELKRQGWRDWATKKKEQDRKARMEALELHRSISAGTSCDSIVLRKS